MFFDSLFDELTKDLFRFNKSAFRLDKPISRIYDVYEIDTSSVLLTFSLLGISPEDIKVSIENDGGSQILKICAETTNAIINKTYSYNNEISVGSVRREIEEYQWEAKDGILYVFLKYKEPSKVKEIKVKDSSLLKDLTKKAKDKELFLKKE